MLREAFGERLKGAMRARDTATVGAVRLILSTLKDRDIAQRGTANPDPLAEPDILRMLLFANVPFAEADAIAREMSK